MKPSNLMAVAVVLEGVALRGEMLIGLGHDHYTHTHTWDYQVVRVWTLQSFILRMVGLVDLFRLWLSNKNERYLMISLRCSSTYCKFREQT